MDTNNDGEIQVSEAESVSFLNVSDKSISSLEGIQSFTNIEVLYCWRNPLTSLDVTQNPNLVTLFCYTTQLTSLDVSQNPNLGSLNVGLNQLTSIDVTQNPNLTRLFGPSNQLTNIDVSQNPNLVWLDVGNNQLRELDLSQNPGLVRLFCSNNEITSIDVSHCDYLVMVEVNNNQLTYLSIQNTPGDPNNPLGRMMAHNNPDLTCIQVEDVERAYMSAEFCPAFWSWCKDASAIFSENCSLSTQDFNQISFTLYPNPTQDVLNIESQEPIDRVRIYSINGSLIKETSSTSTGISELPAGLYFARINIGGNSLTKKFVKY